MTKTPTQDGAITIVLADDHVVIRNALAALLGAVPNFEIVAEAGDVDATRRYLLGHKPSVLILDLNMPGGSSLASIPTFLEISPTTAIVVLTMQDDPAFARAAIRAGALGYVPKDATDDELVSAVHFASEGKTYVQPGVGAQLAAKPAGQDAGGILTNREIEVLRLIALGHTNPEIAEKLVLSVRTVESHRAHVQKKLGITKRAELVQYALGAGLIAP